MTIRVGIVCNEFFHPAVGAMGGFGHLAYAVATLLNGHPEMGMKAILFASSRRQSGQRKELLHGTPVIFWQPSWRSRVPLVRDEPIDVLLSIDYRPAYHFVYYLKPRTPLIIWALDPRTPQDVARIYTLRIPGYENELPEGINPDVYSGLSRVLRLSRLVGRPIKFASPAASIAEKIPLAYRIEMPRVALLPYPLDDPGGKPSSRSQRLILFLGRLDPIKRPWLFYELARSFPEVPFTFLGAPRKRGPGTWRIPQNVAPNVRFQGHADGKVKQAMLEGALVLVNTSIHEALPVSFVEALLNEVPLVGCQDPERVTSRFGRYVGSWDGDGQEGLQAIELAVRDLLNQPALLSALGKRGREWASGIHSPAHFVDCFREICVELGVSAVGKGIRMRTPPK